MPHTCHALSRLGALLGALVLMTSAPALAEEPADAPHELGALVNTSSKGNLADVSDGALASLKVTRVQPVVFTSTTEAAGIRAIFGAHAAAPSDASQGPRVSQLIPRVGGLPDAGSTGFDFAGASSKLDLASLQYGFILGALPLLHASSPEAALASGEQLAKLAPLNAAYAAPLRSQIEAFTASVQSGTPNVELYLGMLSTATQGIASATDPGVERLHGYALLGLWSGLVTLADEAGQLDPHLLSVGNALIMLLEKDANFGGSDLQLAAHVRAINAHLATQKPDATTLHTHVKAMLNVSADAP